MKNYLSSCLALVLGSVLIVFPITARSAEVVIYVTRPYAGYGFPTLSLLTIGASTYGWFYGPPNADSLRNSSFQHSGSIFLDDGNIEVSAPFAGHPVAKIDNAGYLIDPQTGERIQQVGNDIRINDWLEICVLTGSSC
jgi:hypothetical protein